MKIFAALILLLITGFTASAQNAAVDVYQIKNVYQNADLNVEAIGRLLKNWELQNDTDEVVKLFKPVKGKYKVIFFMAASYGLSFRDTKEIFHNILILKVNKNNEILDGLEYVLEWAEPPYTTRLNRVTKTGMKLQKGLQLSQLGWKPLEGEPGWTPKGLIDNLYDFKEIF